MAINMALLAERLRKYRENFDLTIRQLSTKSGITEERLHAFESASIEPTGDELLIIADVFRVNDYRVFLSTKEHQTSFEQIETLFRKFGDELTSNDRWAIQEVVYLAECETFLQEELGKLKRPFVYNKKNTKENHQAEEAALMLRKHLGYSEVAKTKDVFQDIRNIGIHIFRRRLENTSISGVFIKHPSAGKCILVNYNEDKFRQRFTAAHELAHSILDLNDSDEIDITKTNIESRGNKFAAYYLLPASLLNRIKDKYEWNEEKLKAHAKSFEVNPETLTYALAREKYITQNEVYRFKKVRLPQSEKIDSEFSNVSNLGRERKAFLLEKGISEYYVRLCINARDNNLISSARMAEMLLIDLTELQIIYEIFGEKYYD